jgi:hypothetical protein
MIARVLTPQHVAAACFPVPGCCVSGYSTRAGYKLYIRPPQPFAGPPEYAGHGRTCFEALAAAVQMFHDTAHAYPDALVLADPSSFDGATSPAEPF